MPRWGMDPPTEKARESTCSARNPWELRCRTMVKLYSEGLPYGLTPCKIWFSRRFGFSNLKQTNKHQQNFSYFEISPIEGHVFSTVSARCIPSHRFLTSPSQVLMSQKLSAATTTCSAWFDPTRPWWSGLWMAPWGVSAMSRFSMLQQFVLLFSIHTMTLHGSEKKKRDSIGMHRYPRCIPWGLYHITQFFT